jgi:hypothetical protein
VTRDSKIDAAAIGCCVGRRIRWRNRPRPPDRPQSTCRCRQDPKYQHGPYHRWTGWIKQGDDKNCHEEIATVGNARSASAGLSDPEAANRLPASLNLVLRCCRCGATLHEAPTMPDPSGRQRRQYRRGVDIALVSMPRIMRPQSAPHRTPADRSVEGDCLPRSLARGEPGPRADRPRRARHCAGRIDDGESDAAARLRNAEESSLMAFCT